MLSRIKYHCGIAAALLLLLAMPAGATDFTISVTDPAQLAGIAWARAQYNAALPRDGNGNPDGALAADGDYIAMVMRQAVASYAAQKANLDVATAVAQCQAGNCAAAQALIQQSAQQP